MPSGTGGFVGVGAEVSTGVGSGVSVGMGTEVGVRSGSGAEVGTGGAGVGVSVAAEDTVVDTGLAKEVGLVEDSSVPPHPAATKSNIRRIRLVLILLLSRSLVHWLETRINDGMLPRRGESVNVVCSSFVPRSASIADRPPPSH